MAREYKKKKIKNDNSDMTRATVDILAGPHPDLET